MIRRGEVREGKTLVALLLEVERRTRPECTMSDRRRARRRRIPFVRSAVLEVDGRNHIVALTDLSPEGAFLSTRLAVRPEQKLRCGWCCPATAARSRSPAAWSGAASDSSRPPGGRRAWRSSSRASTASVIRRVEEFALEGFLPSPEPPPAAHYEYRTLDRPELSVEELNQLGLDGWLLASALRSPAGVRLILVREL